MDIAFGLFVCVLFCSRLNSNFIFFNEILINFLLVASLYLIIRLHHDFYRLIGLLKVLCFAVVLEFIFSLINFYPSFRPLTFYGFSGNSGLTACLIVVAYPLIMCGVKNKTSYQIVLTIFYFVILTVIQSRAAFLSLIYAVGYFISVSFLSNSNQKKIIKKIFVIVAIVLAILFFLYLLLIKQDSISGRLIIWKITLSNFREYFMSGIGYGEFPVSYQTWQRNYISSGQLDLKFAHLVDLPNNVFNEPLQIFVETGLAGFLSFVYLVYLIYSSKPCIKSSIIQAMKVSLGVVLIFSLFSYPFHSMPILAFVIIILACLSNFSKADFHIIVKPVAFSVLTFFLCFMSLVILWEINKKNKAVESWSKSNVLKKEPRKLVLQLSKIYNQLNENGSFLFCYARAMHESGNYNASINLIDRCILAQSNIDAYLLKGECYEKQKQFAKAEEMYNIVQFTIPSRLTAKSYLFNLYRKQNDSLNAKNIAIDILKSPMKVFSINGYKIKAEVKLYLDSIGVSTLLY
ncbi:O-antigen ligase family protein [Pedobacter steynii]|nr:O-antigen ligase family protein [Pedobacter steynii]NQX41252.1 O-antigen ligase family protein [Pedobacter steynii]